MANEKGAGRLPYVTRVIVAAQHDETVARAILDVQHLVSPPLSLMRPAIVLRAPRTPRQHHTPLREPEHQGAAQ